MTLIQIFLGLIIIYIWRRIYLKYKAGELASREFAEWTLFWIVATWFVIMPEAASYLAFVLGVGRGSDLVVYVAILIIFYLLFKVFMRLEKTNRAITKMVNDQAVKEADHKGADQVK